tara:strand:+ start:8256 stop:8477 length:222 start_codon:yes stop_codon:yes gene_type:complete
MKTGDLIIDKDTRDVGLIIDIDHDHEESYGAAFGRGHGIRTYPYRVTGLDNGYTTWLEKDYIEINCEVISEGG